MLTNRTVDEISPDIKNAALLLYWNYKTAEFYLPNTILLSLYLLIGIPGNVTVILIYQFRLRSSRDGRYFITPLAYLDLVALVITGTLNITRNTKPFMFPGNVSCKLLLYLSYVSTNSSVFLLNAIAAQRFQKICRPFGKQMNRFWKRFAVLCCVLSAVLLYTPVLYFYGTVEVTNEKLYNVTGVQCNKLPGSPSEKKGLRLFQGVGFFITICNIVVITILYVLITISIVKQANKMKTVKINNAESSHTLPDTTAKSYAQISQPSMQSTCGTSDAETSFNTTTPKQVKIKDNQKGDAKKSVIRVSFMFMTISFVGFLAYLPSLILILLETNNPTFWKQFPEVAFHFCLAFRRIYMLNHLANPFIYGAFDLAFRQEMRKMFCKK